jgi:hypothetical protein
MLGSAQDAIFSIFLVTNRPVLAIVRRLPLATAIALPRLEEDWAMRRLVVVLPALLMTLALETGCQRFSRRKEPAPLAPSPAPLAPSPVGVQVGQVAPDLEGADLDGQRLHLADYRGRVVVLSFWSET